MLAESMLPLALEIVSKADAQGWCFRLGQHINAVVTGSKSRDSNLVSAGLQRSHAHSTS